MSQIKTINRKNRGLLLFKRQLPLYLMLLIPILLVFVFAYGPMMGLIMAFQDYLPNQGWYVFGSEFVGLKHFRTLFSDPEIWQIIRNTVTIAVLKIVTGTIMPIAVAIMLNECRTWFKRFVQTFIFLPYFISWVIMSGVLTNLLSARFFDDPDLFVLMVIVSNLWKDAGYGTIVFLAAITAIDPTLHEAAKIDGAGHMRRCQHITLPGMVPIIVLMTVLNMGNIMNAGFEQLYNLLLTTEVYSKGEILDTYIYRRTLNSSGSYSYLTAVGLFKSVISTALIAIAYFIAYKGFDYKIF